MANKDICQWLWFSRNRLWHESKTSDFCRVPFALANDHKLRGLLYIIDVIVLKTTVPMKMQFETTK